ncbi:FemAB family XrtA/PEP-CTERM system-associated protein [Tsuneonella mangrovi]|uniref:FemAB family XrtA/PEP-CTERM system-associated protein n=1 Tax=Tsuneonella mangrovi TaxID=1982042 RepID=UPI000BA29004|nr:FemAB family XrtA/PEP-CTERM system-associated protein [Tsuneonella mangrovi]
MNAPFPLCREALSLVDLADPGEVGRIEAFVAEMGGSLFHRPAWIRAVEQGTGQRAHGIVAERGGAITGWLPLTEVHSLLFPRALVSSGFGVGGGPLAANELTKLRLCEAAAELAQRLACASVELRSGTAPDDWIVRSDSHANFSGELVDDDDAQLLAIPRKQRAEVRKGLQHDFGVSVGGDRYHRSAQYALYAESVRNLGTPVFPRSLFDAMLDAFGDDADILLVSDHGAPQAAVLTFYHCGVAMPYWGGGNWLARATRANERMYYELMLHARRKGCSRFDFGRSKLGSGAFAYKKNWGFEPEPLAYATWTAPDLQARDVDPTSDAYSAKIALWKKLPLAISNRIGPVIARGLA